MSDPEKKKQRRHLEESIQKQIVLWCKQHDNPKFHGIFHVPNGDFRDKRTAIKLKKMGVKAGIPDLMLPLENGKVFWLELKTKKGKLSAVQKVVIAKLKKKGHLVEVAFGYDQAVEILERVISSEETNEV